MRIKKGFVLRRMCGEHVVTADSLEQINFNKLVTLNESAAYLWQAVEDRDFPRNFWPAYWRNVTG